jgi:hypothetical protein
VEVLEDGVVVGVYGARERADFAVDDLLDCRDEVWGGRDLERAASFADAGLLAECDELSFGAAVIRSLPG